MGKIGYEPRFKTNVPTTPPQYFEKAVKCYINKMRKRKKVAIICREKCKLSWLCLGLSSVAYETYEILTEQRGGG